MLLFVVLLLLLFLLSAIELSHSVIYTEKLILGFIDNGPINVCGIHVKSLFHFSFFVIFFFCCYLDD